jgi:hypothetical protein
MNNSQMIKPKNCIAITAHTNLKILKKLFCETATWHGIFILGKLQHENVLI